MLVALIAACLAQVPAPKPVPVHQTRYGRAVLRFEGRTNTPERDASKRQAAEAALARAGVQARWIEVVDVEGSPLIRTDHIPCSAQDPEGNETALRDWVREIHANGMAAMTWYPLSICRSGNLARPDWRQGFIVPDPIPSEESLFCCPVSGYGDALIGFIVEAIGRLGLDGVWFDGSAWTNIWQRPYALTCNCGACAGRFRADTGLEIPSRPEFADPVFRKWVRWRFDTFGAYIERAAREIRAAHPSAAVVINHYHRPGIPWRSAVPLDRYAADIITGSEATGPDLVDLTMRLCRAYGRAQSEVWRPFDLGPTTDATAEVLIHHVLGCYVAGGHPSLGGNPFDPGVAAAAARLSPTMKAVAPRVRARSLPAVALHVSQQTETFYFGRGEPAAPASDAYWSSLSAWTKAMGEAHASPDYVYDADLSADTLKPYRALLMPLSIALTEKQAREALAYARLGGLLVLGPAAGQATEEGEPAGRNLLAETLGFRWQGLPAPDGSGTVAVAMIPARGGAPIGHSGWRTPVTLNAGDWRPVLRARVAGGSPAVAVAERTYGKGRVIVCDTDIGAQTGPMLVEGGKTECAVTEKAARSGRYGLRFVDDPVAPASYYPDLENRLIWFGAPKYAGCVLECDLRVMSEAAHVSIELRSSSGPLEGPIVQIEPGGRVVANGKPVGLAKQGEWVRLRIACTFASEGRQAAYTVTMTDEGGATRSVEAAPGNPAFRGLDWFVVYGPGQVAATFDLDNLTLSRTSASGGAEPAVALDFEGGPRDLAANAFARSLASEIAARSALPVRVDAPRHVWSGVFADAPRGGSSRVLVHLHNRQGSLSAGALSGPRVAINTSLDVKSARRLIAGKAMPIAKAGGRIALDVGPVPLYEVVELTLAPQAKAR